MSSDSTSGAARYCCAFLAALLLMLAAVASFNAVIDPYGRYRLVTLPGFNAYKSEASHVLRLYKAIETSRLAPSAIILGSSRSDIGMRAHPPGWGDGNDYNLSIDGATPGEMLGFLRHAQAAGRLHAAAVGLDFETFDLHTKPPPGFNLAILRDSARFWPRPTLFLVDLPALISRSAIGASLRTLSSQYDQGVPVPATARYTADGQENAERGMRLRMALMGQSSPAGFFAASYRREHRLIERIAPDFALGPPAAAGKPPAAAGKPLAAGTPLADLAAMLAFSRAHGIRMVLFVQPAQACFATLLHQAGLWPQFEAWKRRLVAIVDEDAAQHPGAPAVPLWDFSPLSSVTSEPPPPGPDAPPMRGFWDIVHYRQRVGDWIWDRLLNHTPSTAPPDFGVRLTAATIEEHLATDRAALDAALPCTPMPPGGD